MKKSKKKKFKYKFDINGEKMIISLPYSIGKTEILMLHDVLLKMDQYHKNIIDIVDKRINVVAKKLGIDTNFKKLKKALIDTETDMNCCADPLILLTRDLHDEVENQLLKEAIKDKVKAKVDKVLKYKLSGDKEKEIQNNIAKNNFDISLKKLLKK